MEALPLMLQKKQLADDNHMKNMAVCQLLSGAKSMALHSLRQYATLNNANNYHRQICELSSAAVIRTGRGSRYHGGEN
ncbi:hypothetical protein [Pseudomonas sp. TE3610]